MRWVVFVHFESEGIQKGIPDNKADFPGSTVDKESACNAGDVDSIPRSGRSPEEGMATHSSILLGKSHGQRSLVGYSPWGC